MFSNRKQGNKYVQNICLHLIGVSKEHVEACIQWKPIGFFKVITLANKWSPKPITIDMFGLVPI
jgi:hypothetical protein